MAPQLVAVSALLLGSAFLMMAGGLHGILLPIRGDLEGFTIVDLGLVGTGWAIGFVSGCLLVPTIVRRVGHIRSYGVLGSVAAVTILLNLLVIHPIAWIILRALSGFCFAGAAMIVESWLNEKSSAENRGTIFSVYQMVNFAASTAGQVLLAIQPPNDYFFFVLGGILYCLAILPTALSTAASPRPLKTARLDLRALYANSPVAAVACLLVGMANGGFGALGPVYGQRIGLAVSDVAYLMAGALLGGSLIQFPLGRLSDRMDRRKVLVGIAAGAVAIGTIIAFFNPRSPMVAVGMVIAYGAMAYPIYALAVAHANDFAATEDFVKIAGGLLLLYGAGTMIGPIVAAFAMERFAPQGLFAYTAVVHSLIIAHTLYRMTRRAAPDLLTRETFQGLPLPKNVTPESAVLDPRAAEDATADDAPPKGED